MLLVILTALTAVCGAAKLDKTYLPPITAKTAGGSPGALQAPFRGSIQGLELPTGGYTNDAQGVVVDAVNPGTRTSGDEPTGLGGPRVSYGSTDSKVGDAAFKASFGSPGGASTRIAPGFGAFVDSDDSGDSKTRGSNLKFSTDVVSDNYSYGFETDNGIAVGENGVAVNGVQAQGGYSYKGDDGKKYEVTYTADEGGYKPQGQHLPTPPPIPEEILKSLEKNAKEEAAGLSDDGSYDAQKYNDEGDYSSNGAAFNNVRPTIGGGDATASSFVNQGNQAYRPSSGVLIGAYNPGGAAQGFGQVSGNKQPGFGLNQGGAQGFGVSGETVSIGGQYAETGSKNKFGSQGKFGASSQFGSQSTFNSQTTENRFGVQGSKPEGFASNSADRTQTYNNLPESLNENTAFSSAVSSGSGSATASASTNSNGFKNQYIPPTNNFGSAGQYDHGSKTDSLVGASFPAPSSASASASFSGTPTFGHQYSGSQQSSAHGSTTSPQFSPTAAAPSYDKFGSSYSQSGQSVQIGVTDESSGQSGFQAQTGNNEISTSSGQNQIGSTNLPFSGVQPTRPTFGFGSLSSQGPTKVPDTELTTPFESNEPVSAFNHQTSNQALGSINSFSQTGPTDATFASSTQKPALSQQQGSDNSYYYKQPSKPFVTPSPSFSSQLVNNNQQTAFVSSLSQEQSKYPTAPTQSTTGQYQSSSYNHGVTQAAISPFSSGSPSSAGSFASQSSQFGLKPTPSTQFGQSSQLTGAQQTLSQKPSSQLGLKPIGQSQTQFGQASSSQNYDSSQSPTQQYQGTVYQYNKPAETLPAPETDSQAKPSQISTDSKFESYQTSSQFSSQAFGNPSSTLQQAQTAQGSAIGSQSNNLFGQKPQSIQGGIASSAVSHGQFTQVSHFGQKPFTSSQNTGSGSSFSQQLPTALGSTFSSNKESQQSVFEKKPATSTQSVFTSNSAVTQKPYSFGQKPFGSSQFTGYQQTNYGSTAFTVGQKPQSSSFTSNTLSQGQASQLGTKPSSLAFQKPQFGTANSQSVQSNGLVSTTGQSFGQKPISSFNQQSQFGSGSSSFTSNTGIKGQSASNSQFGVTGSSQNTQSVQGSGSAFTVGQTSFGQKPTNAFNQQSQFGSGSSSFTSNTGIKGQSAPNSQFGVTGSSQNTQSGLGSGSALTSGQTSFGQKPTNAFNQQSQFGSGSSSFTSNTGIKGQSAPNSQFGVTGSSQHTQSVQGSGSALTAGQTSFGQKPSNAFNQQSQFGLGSSSFTSNTGIKGQSAPNSQFGVTGSSQNTQSGLGSGSALTTGQTSFGQKPTNAFNQQSQFGSGTSSFTSNTGIKGQSAPHSQFGVTGSSQNTHSVQGSGSAFTTGQTAFGQKPTNAFNQQSQFGSSSSSFSSNTGSKGQTAPNSQFGVTGSSQNTQSVQGSGSALTTGQTSFGQKPTNAFNQQSQFGSSTSSFSSNTGIKGQSAPHSQFGVTGSSQNTHSVQGSGSAFTTGQTAFGQKPTNAFNQQSQFGSSSSSFSSNTGSKGQTAPNSQFGVTGSSQNTQSVQGSGSALTTGQTSFGQKPTNAFNHQSQFGSSTSSFTSNTGIKGQSAPHSQFGVTGSSQNTQSVQGSGSAFTTGQTAFGQKPTNAFNQQSQFGSSSSSFSSNTGSKGQTAPNSQFGVTGSSQNTQSVQGSGSALTTGQTSFGQKPTNAFNQQSQFGSSSTSFTSNTGIKGQSAPNSQFGVTGSSQNTQSVQGSGSAFTVGQTSFGQKPTNAFNQQSQFGSSSSSFTSNTGIKGQSAPNSQFGVTGSSQNTQSGLGSGSVLTTGQTSFGQKPTNAFNQQGQFGSSSSSFTSNTGIKGQSAPNSQFGVTGSSQNTQSVQGSGSALTTGQTSFGQKPSNEFNQQGQFGSSSSSFTSNTGIKGQSAPNSQFGVTGSSQNTQSGLGSGSVLTTGQTSFGQKPTNAFNQQSQFGSGSSSFTSNTGSKGQAAQNSQFGLTGTSQTSFGKKPVGPYQQSAFGGSTNSNKFSQTSQYDKKPSTTQSGSNFQLSGFGTTSTSQTGQNSQVQGGNSLSSAGQSAGSTYQQLGSTNSVFGQKPQLTQGSSLPSKGQSVQTSQFGVTGSSQNTGSSSSFGSGSSYQQTQFSSSSGSQFDQKPQTASGTISQQSTQFGIKPLNQKPFVISQTSGSSYEKNQFGTSGSLFTQKPLTAQTAQKPSSTFGSYTQTSQFGTQTKKPFGSTQTPFLSQFSSTTGQYGQKPLAQVNAFASGSTNSNKFGSTQLNQGSKYQQPSQFGSFAQKPIVSSLSQTNYQQTQYTQTSGSQPQVGQALQFNVGSGQFGSQSSFGSQAQKPFGSSQTTYQQTQFNQGQKPNGASQGSGFQINQSAGDQKTQPTQSSIQATAGDIQSESGDGYVYNKQQTAFNFASQFGSQANGAQDQKLQSPQTSLNSEVSTSQVKPIKPFGSTSSQSFLQNAQSSLGSAQFGGKPTKPTDSGISTSQSSLSQFSGQPFKPASTVPSYQSETSAVSSSQFGLQPTKTPEIVPFSGKPFQSSSTQSPSNLGSLSPLGSGSQFGLQSPQSVAVKPSQSQFSIEPFKTNEFSSTAPSLPSRFGSDLSSKPDELAVSTLQTTIVPVPGYEINTSYQGEEFGGPRDPPRFDENTGYHY